MLQIQNIAQARSSNVGLMTDKQDFGRTHTRTHTDTHGHTRTHTHEGHVVTHFMNCSLCGIGVLHEL